MSPFTALILCAISLVAGWTLGVGLMRDRIDRMRSSISGLERRNGMLLAALDASNEDMRRYQTMLRHPSAQKLRSVR